MGSVLIMILINKKILVLVMVIFIFSSVSVVAEDNQMGLRTILDRVLKENVDLKLAELSLKEARISYKKSNLQNLMTNSKLQALMAELQMIQSEENYRTQKNGIIIDIASKYLDIIKVKQKINTNENEVQLERNKVEKIKAEVEVGYKGKLDLFNQQTAYQDKVNSLEMNRESMQQKVKVLKQKAGIDQNDKVRIEIIKLEKPKKWVITEAEAIKTAIENSSVIEIRKKQFKVAESDLERAKISGTPKLDLQQKEIALKKSKLNLSRETQNIENSVQNQFFQYKQALKSMNIAEKMMVQANEQYKIIKEQYQAGLVSKNDLLTAEVNSMKSAEGLTSAIINYYINKFRLQDVIGMKLEVNINSEEDSA